MTITLIALLAYIIGFPLLWFFTWVRYLAFNGIMLGYHRNLMARETTFFGKCVLYPGLAADVLLNWLYLTPLLWHYYPKPTVTEHLGRLLTVGGLRQHYAENLCRIWLDPFTETGKHCCPTTE
jgi:hypothetical protein